MNAQPHILIVGADAKFRQELESALAALPGLHAAMHLVGDFRQAVETARTRSPDIALVEMGANLSAFQGLAREIRVGSPRTSVVGVFRADAFDPEISESAVLIEAIRAGVQDFLRRPVSSGDLEQLFDRLAASASAEPARFGKTVALVSNKGGVGKSTLAVNLAVGLAMRHPQRVLLVDASLQMGTCATMLDLQPATTLTDAVRQRDRLDETLIRQLAVPHSSGLHVLAAPRDAVESTEIDDEIIARVLSLARRAYDYVIVDTFPLLDRTVMAVLDLCDRAYLVLENVVPTLLGGVKFVELLEGVGFDRARCRVILNRHTRIAGNPSPADVARRLGRAVDHVLPYHRQVVTAANTGEPYVLQASRWRAHGRAILRLIDEVEALAQGAATAPPGRNGASAGNPTEAPHDPPATP